MNDPTRRDPPESPRRSAHRDDERRFLLGRRSRRAELASALRIFAEYVRGLRALHFVGPCVTVFGSARLAAEPPRRTRPLRILRERVLPGGARDA